MRKINYFLLALAVFGFSGQLHAQLFVKGSSFVYNKGVSLYVKGEVELEANSNIYLRQEGQLLQGGTTTNGTNKGTGVLSVFQEGTMNAYAYNYWCSPVGNVTANTTGNRDFGITQLGVPTNTPTATIGFTPATMVTSSYNGTSSTGALGIASYWIYKYSIPSGMYSGWQSVGSASTISAGQGFTMKGVNGDDNTNVGEVAVNNPPGSGGANDNQRYDFRGKPNDGDIPITVGINTVPTPNVGLLTLTGNPYPSAIDLKLFFNDNPNLDGKAYYWVQDKTIESHNLNQYRGGYAIYNFATTEGYGYYYTDPVMYYYTLAGEQIVGLPPPGESTTNINKGRFAPVGQGFMVKGRISNPAVPFTFNPGLVTRFRNTHRVFVKEGPSNESVFQKNGNAANSTTDYGFYDDIPNLAGIDYTQVSKAPPPHIKINCSLNSGAIRQLALCFMNGTVDGVDKADTISPDVAGSLPADMYLFLDNTEYIHSATTFDINKRFPVGFRNTGTGIASYKMQVSEFINFNAAEHVYLYDADNGLYHDIKDNSYDLLLAPGTYHNRFEITFTNQILGLDTNIANNLVIVQNNPNQQLSIANPASLDVKSVLLYDIAGKLVLNKTNLGAQTTYQFSTASLSEGVYVVKLQTTDNQSLSQKIIVKKKN